MWSNLEFRKAVSYAINRPEIQESVFLGTGVGSRHGIIKPGHPWYPGDEVAKMYTEFDPDEANKIAGRAGLHQAGLGGLPPAA